MTPRDEPAAATLESVDQAFAQLRPSHLTHHVCTCPPGRCVLDGYDPEEPPLTD